ncbi:PREDICTED: probable S-adenosylmethionine-dependent methyltransferase At5g38100 [Nelumbo nucifera]|uniref:Probable S-adenosylmethionine-dependent methyltransferase At5g38100 n=1 Tax=Nelumbo nucifera TaxID=4432 RepID=A0A1U7Z811_NELNU|nr:PREDICTED: probable S-adenosylmethionine-dependent methyltransferase At5g38100 [Nelumbo nucifera]
MAKQTSEAFPMNGGNGPYSYAHNSTYQKEGVDSTKAKIQAAIAEKLDIKHLPSSLKTFTIADLGCSFGPNTFIAVQNIIEAVVLKYKSQGTFSSDVPEFQVLFNDHSSNDFNKLFESLSPEMPYYVVGVPGSFHGRLFPKASVHFVHSSYALHWISRVPPQVVDKSSPAWNQGRVHYASAPNEVLEAYSAQFSKDIQSFLDARAQEMVSGGLMTIIIPALPNETPVSQSTFGAVMDLLGSCFLDMAKMGLMSEDKVDSFNLPLYATSPKELEALIERNGCFSVEGMEALNRPMTHDAAYNAKLCLSHMRATLEGPIREHFGTEIIDELFHRFAEKSAMSSIFINSDGWAIDLLVILKRN